ncbi:MAG: hypothetical protein Q8N05_16790 [Bacteroidota bacterium]|nr:hypothetical protein [Bacteroidota bacterium]
MKNDLKISKPNKRFINLMMQLLHWMSHLELSGGILAEHDVGRQMPESSDPVLINGNGKIYNQDRYKNKMRTNIRLTNIIMQLLHWMSHLELSDGYAGEHDIGQLMPQSAGSGSGIEILKYQLINKNTMKTKHRFLKWLAVLLVLIASTSGAMATPGVPTVNPQSTLSTTPTITGTYDGPSGLLSVVVNGITYPVGADLTVPTATDWTLTIPVANALTAGNVYSVTALIGATPDITTNELTIVNQEICPGLVHYKVTPGDVQNTFAWSVSPGASTIDWTIATASASNTDITWADPASATVYTVTFVETDYITSCTTTKTYLVKVNPNNTVGTASTTPTLCINTALTAITHATTRATGIGTATGLPAGVSAAWLADVITISGTPTASGTFNYSIPLTGGCGSVSATGTITVTPANTAGTASTTPTLCISTALTDITHATTGATGIGSATGLPAGVSAAWLADVITISGTPTEAGTFSYSIPLTGGCGSVSATGTITVNPLPTASISVTETSGATNNDGTICAGDLATLTASGGGSYSWNTGESTAVVNKGAGTYTVTVTNGNGCTNTATVTITATPLPTTSEISVGP